MTEEREVPDIEEFLRSMRPSSVPDEALIASPELGKEIGSWKRSYAVSVLSGLQTDPEYHANDIRIEWLQRLVLNKSSGKRKPTSKNLSKAMNQFLVEAQVYRLEDPLEDLFCDLINTQEGSYRIFLGRWESAASYTQTLYDAFVSLPEDEAKQQALSTVHALLCLSDVLADRANVDRDTLSSGKPMGQIQLPGKEKLDRLGRRVRFSTTALGKLNIDIKTLSPFVLKPDHLAFVSDREFGDTPLEFHPLMLEGNNLVVVSPSNISMAIRAVLINTAISGGMKRSLERRLLEQQESYSERTGFWPTPHIRLSPPNKLGLRASVCKYDEGHYCHIIQLPVSFDGFPQVGFSSLRKLTEETSKFISEDIQKFWNFIEEQGDCRKSTTVLLLSGWGPPHSVATPFEETTAPDHWQFMALSFSDAAIMGACDNGKFRDIVRLLQQSQRLEKDGFSFMNPNGLLNLFGFWRSTEGNLIPEHMWDIEPPFNLVIDVGEVLVPRLEGISRQDQRTLPRPSGEYKIVQRKDWSPEGLKPIYTSVSDIIRSRLVGAVSVFGRTWWIEAEMRQEDRSRWNYQIWNAILEWLAAAGPKIIENHGHIFPRGSYILSINFPAARDLYSGDDSRVGSELSLSESVVCRLSSSTKNFATITIKDDWTNYLGSPENDAEVELVASVLEGILDRNSEDVTRNTIVQIVRDSIGSTSWRWLHLFKAKEPIQRLAAQGLIGPFQSISFSAHSLVKCGSVWSYRDRSAGSEIDGEDECRKFLKDYRDNMLDSFIEDIRRFDRKTLISVAAHSYQAARGERKLWRGSIRALRAIRGNEADEAAFSRQNEINALQRATKTVCEIAACEATTEGGLKPSRAEIDEMYAKALLLFGNGQLFSAIRGGLIEAKLRVSPAGDVLSERKIFSQLLEPSATWMHSRALNEADKRYGESQKEEEVSGERMELDANFRKAIETEYEASVEAFVDIQYALLQIAESRNEGVFFAKHSELQEALKANEAYSDEDVSVLLERLTLKSRPTWFSGLSENDRDVSRFDRPYSLINRPLLAIDNEDDPTVLVSPIIVSDAIMYSFSGLYEGVLQGKYWTSSEARKFAGLMANAAGEKFEDIVEARLRNLGLDTRKRCRLSALLNDKVDPKYGDIDVFVVPQHKKTVWVIETKNLSLCRTESEVAARLSEYRGQMVVDSKGRKKPDKLLRHIQRVQYLRDRRDRLAKTLKLEQVPEVKGLIIVDVPQPMNFHMLEELPDATSAFLDAINEFEF